MKRRRLEEEVRMKDVEFMTGKEKELVLKQWNTFVKNGFQFRHFSKRLYNHLTLHCSFIAHYNKHGFYDVYFTEPEKTRAFMQQFDRVLGGVSTEYGTRSWLNDNNYSDLNNAMCEIMEKHRMKYDKELQDQAKDQDLDMARRLLEKHGIAVEI